MVVCSFIGGDQNRHVLSTSLDLKDHQIKKRLFIFISLYFFALKKYIFTLANLVLGGTINL